jgi:hypothetical protein
MPVEQTAAYLSARASQEDELRPGEVWSGPSSRRGVTAVARLSPEFEMHFNVRDEDDLSYAAFVMTLLPEQCVRLSTLVTSEWYEVCRTSDHVLITTHRFE